MLKNNFFFFVAVSSMVEHCVICGGDFQIDLTVSETHIYDGEAGNDFIINLLKLLRII